MEVRPAHHPLGLPDQHGAGLRVEGHARPVHSRYCIGCHCTAVCTSTVPDERFGSAANQCSLSTPKDATATHILVFPTSATAQVMHSTLL